MSTYDVRRSENIQLVIDELARQRDRAHSERMYKRLDNLIDGMVSDLYDIQMVLEYTNCAEGAPELAQWLREIANG